MNTNGLVFFKRTEVQEIAQDECGNVIVGEVSYIVAEADDGRRWAHFFPFAHQFVEYGDDDGYPYVSITSNDGAEGAINRLLAQILQAEELDMDYWNPIDPCYGSQAYLEAEPFIFEREWQESLAEPARMQI